MNEEFNISDVLKELSNFIESFDLNEIIGLNDLQMEKINNNESHPAFFPYKVNEKHTTENRVVINGDDWYKIVSFKNTISNILNKKQYKFSKDYILKVIQNAIILHVSINRNEETEFNNVYKFLQHKLKDNPKNYRVFIEIDGFVLDRRNNFEIGNCSIFKVTPVKFKKMLQYNRKLDDFEIAWMKREKKEYVGKTYAEVKVIANDSNVATRYAKIYLNRIIDIINFFASLYHDYNLWSGNIKISVFEQKPKLTSIHVYAENENIKSNSYLKIEHERDFLFQEMKKKKELYEPFKKIIRFINEHESNNFIKRFLTSIQWAGKAMWEPRIEISFLNYITSLESLLLPNDEGELSFRLALYGSHLLSMNKDHRMKIFNKLKCYYDKRSKIVHSGKYEIEDDDLIILRRYVINIILFILNDKKWKFIDSKDSNEFDEKLKSLVME